MTQLRMSPLGPDDAGRAGVEGCPGSETPTAAFLGCVPFRSDPVVLGRDSRHAMDDHGFELGGPDGIVSIRFPEIELLIVPPQPESGRSERP